MKNISYGGKERTKAENTDNSDVQKHCNYKVKHQFIGLLYQLSIYYICSFHINNLNVLMSLLV